MAVTNSGVAESVRVAVLRSGGEYTLVTRAGLAEGSWLFTLDGELTDAPTRYSVQLGPALHLDLPDTYGLEEIMDRFYWRFMNHSCEPNAMIRGRDVFALRTAEPGEEITFDYHTTEYELAEPFDCRCGSARCVGRVRGFRFLSTAQRERIRPWLADHLRALLDHEPAATALGEGRHVADR
ncbi:SET domain-containing protein-lysine N-methyltransferase [Gandjariella thermophila]|uniref:Post-SET domain-containing protein n=1 Tax=Gandjariella thermophila TaxID=1931992 RepID=A0A4D4J0U9_9PSEU|nr:SET domain-containing protein-lysine N-methyltransferase [Gandjariella thermophila]GDY28994.1 hypothetical protein GTS_06270 [Gandjariella thermophila]